MALEESNYLRNVRAQYEDYPYPYRDPECEKGVLISSHGDSLDCINHFCFGGKRDFTKGIRVLVAGGGTGDGTIHLAEQLRDTPSEIVYLDMSSASMAVAKERAKIRQLTNITWVHESILDISEARLGLFDYISCTGVLHHLDQPSAGLEALKSVLAPDGSMLIMLYARYGRTAVYQLQDLLRMVNKGFSEIPDKIQNTKTILKNTPVTNWSRFKYAMNIQSELKTDVGIYDLLLHTQDRSYTVLELYEFVENSGLHVNKLFNHDHPLGDMLFEPKTFIRDPELLKVLEAYPEREQAAISELLFGQLAKQICYISHQDKHPPSRKNLDLIPSISTTSARNYHLLKAAFSASSKQVKLNELVSVSKSQITETLFSKIDGKNSIQRIVDETLDAHKNLNVTFDAVLAEFGRLYDVMVKISSIYLRAENIPGYASIEIMEGRMHKIHGEKQCLAARQKFFDSLTSS